MKDISKQIKAKVVFYEEVFIRKIAGLERGGEREREISMVKSTSCSCPRLGFSSQCLHDGSKLPVTPMIRDMTPFLSFWASDMHVVHRHA